MKGKNLFSGFEVLHLQILMLIKVWSELFFGFFAVHIAMAIVFLGIVWPLKAKLFLRAIGANLAALAGFRDASVTIPPGYWSRLGVCFLLALPVWFFLPLLRRKVEKQGEHLTTEKHIRGMRLTTESELSQKLQTEPCLLPFGSVLLPRKYESEHIFIGGKPRTGKTVCLKQQLEAVRQVGARAVIYDFKGDFVETFYREGVDFILNPLDKRGVIWRVSDEIQTEIELDAFCESLIPEVQNENRIFSVTAKDVLKGVLAYCIAERQTSNLDFWEAVTRPRHELAEMCRSTPYGAAGYSHIQNPDSKLAGSTISELLSHVAWLKYADDTGQGRKITTGSFLAQPGANIFLTGRPEIESIIKPYTALFIDFLGRRLLSMPDAEHDLDRKTFFFLDEFGNMQMLPTVKRLLTAGGSKGATVVIGIQDFAAIQKIYGREDAETIFNACGTTFLLNIADPATAKYFSGRFGTREVERPQENFRMTPEDKTDGMQFSRTEKVVDLLLPSEIQSLPKLEGFLKVPEHEPARIHLQISKINNAPAISPSFAPKALKKLQHQTPS